MRGRSFDPDDLRRAVAATPGRSMAARTKAVAVSKGCSWPTVMRAVKRVDERRDGVRSPAGPSHDVARAPAVLARSHPAVVEGRTIFPTTVRDPEETVLKSGVHSAKIGGTVLKGAWKGMPIFTLTLEERATCPKTCPVWASCYGNGTPFARRFRHGAELEWRLEREVAALELAHPAGFVVRLHNLGDFYSWRYVELWRTLLERHAALRVFGYTARVDVDRDPIARTLAHMVREHWPRFAVRFSNGWSDRCTTVLVEHEAGAPADAIVCPAQTGRTESCSSCALCWSTTRRIAFIRH